MPTRRCLAAFPLLLLAGVLPAAARQAAPVAGGTGGDEFVVLGQAAVADLPPAPLFVGLVRFDVPAGAATPTGVDRGPTLAWVESGAFAATLDGLATLTRAGDPSPRRPAPGAAVALGPGDTLLIPAGTASRFRNVGPERGSLLVVMLVPDDPFGPFARARLDGVDVELLVGRELATAAAPAVVILARQTFAPGGGFDPTASPGPVLGRVVSGRLTYVVDAGDSQLFRGAGREERLPEPVPPGSQTLLAPDDAFAEEAGTVSGAYPAGHAAIDLLLVFVTPPDALAPAASSTPAAATPVA